MGASVGKVVSWRLFSVSNMDAKDWTWIIVHTIHGVFDETAKLQWGTIKRKQKIDFFQILGKN